MIDLVVVGLGHVGLPTATLFAKSGLTVAGVDSDPSIVAEINSGRSPIVEPGLDTDLRGAIASGNLVAQTECGDSSVYVIAVPTPLGDDHRPDLSHVKSAATQIAPHLRAGSLVVLESTCPIGSTEQLANWLASERPDLSVAGATSDGVDVHIAYCPERVLPGNAMHELVHNDRLIGGLSPQCAERAAAFFAKAVQGECVATTARTAEMAKLTENAFRDVNIAFANELSLIASEVGVDVWELIELANRHPRVNVLRPGPGVGGHCLAVDPWFLADASDSTLLIQTARSVNDGKPRWVADKVAAVVRKNSATTVACLGLAYKPDVDDFRESAAIEVVKELTSCGIDEILVVEPHLDVLPDELRAPMVELCELNDALARADVIVGLVAHREIRSVADRLPVGCVVIDPAGVFSQPVALS